MTKQYHRFLKYLYLVELTVFAAPTLGVLVQFIAAMIFFSYGGLIFTIYNIATNSSDVEIDQIVVVLISSGIVTATLISLWQFATLSISYLSEETIRTEKHRRKFLIGLSFCILPIIFCMLAAHREYSVGEPDPVWLFYFTGLPMIVPVIHLAFATKPHAQ